MMYSLNCVILLIPSAVTIAKKSLLNERCMILPSFPNLPFFRSNPWGRHRPLQPIHGGGNPKGNFSNYCLEILSTLDMEFC